MRNVNLSPYPSWYSLYRNTPYDEQEIRQRPVESSQRDEKRNSSPKKNGKGNFDSNSYFMLRPLRREPMEQHERSDMSRFIGKHN